MKRLLLAVACLGLGMFAGEAGSVTFNPMGTSQDGGEYKYSYQFNFWNTTDAPVVIDLTSLLSNSEGYVFVRNSAGGLEPNPDGTLDLWTANSLIPDSALLDANFSGMVRSDYAGGQITVNPGCTAVFRGQCYGDKSYSLWAQSEIMSVYGQWVEVKFWGGIDALTKNGQQYVNILDGNGFTVTEDKPTQNNAVGNGAQIGCGGAGNALNTSNICFQITNSTTEFNNRVEFALEESLVPSPPNVLQSTKKIFAEQVLWASNGAFVAEEERIEGKELACIAWYKLAAGASPRGKAAADRSPEVYVFARVDDGELQYAFVTPADLKKWGYKLPYKAASASKYEGYMRALAVAEARGQEPDWTPVTYLPDSAMEVATVLLTYLE